MRSRTFCNTYRKDPETGKNNFCILQAEDELAAIGMVIGASWNGARAFTSTSGPGISLMSELIGLAYYAEIPAVIVDVQRTGPSTGMPTRTQQGDIMMAAYASHGDTKHIVLFPANPEECFTLAVAAFDLAERFQTPVFMLSDLDIGMNDWVCPRFKWDDSYRPNRGRVLTAAELEKMAASTATPTRTPTTSRRARCPAFIPRARSSRAARATTSTAATPRSPTSIRRSWTACCASTAPRRTPSPSRPSACRPTRPSGSSRWVAAIRRCARRSPCCADRGIVADYMRIRAFPFGENVRSSWPRTIASSSSSRTATPS